jgi:hypothetical protein
MQVFSYHLINTSYIYSLKAMAFPLQPKSIPGLINAEFMSAMTLGARIFSPSRILVRQMVLFAQWENQEAIDKFLTENKVGKVVAKGWHTRLAFVRQWGHIHEWTLPEETATIDAPDAPVIAVTLARVKFREVPRFINWGRPVEKLVRDHPGTTLSMASIRLPNTVSTFSVWKSLQEMTDMVHGRSTIRDPKRHVEAMKERERKDFHYEFTTLRFKPLAEFGQWDGRTEIIPNLHKHT